MNWSPTIISIPKSSDSVSSSSSRSKTRGRLTCKDLRLHKLVFQDDALPDGTELPYFVHRQKCIEGYKKGFGIFCFCCQSEVSPSQFEAHAGWASHRKPYLHIYTSNGVSLHELFLKFSQLRKLSAEENDDLCSICADGGDLLCCDNCPRAFHTENDLDEVLQSQTVYSNVSKGVLAKSKDLVTAFGTDDQTNICLEILDKGELQVAGKERDSQLSSQFRDIATTVMQKTINPETQRPYTISMIERLMHEIHFAVDLHKSLDVIRELQKHLSIKLSPMRLRLYVPEQKFSSLSEKLNDWTASIVSKDESGSQLSIQFSTKVLRMQQEIARLRENTAHFQATVETKLETLRCELLK
ncbi:unnamed protein product [Camellia sinensis]